MRSIRMRSIRCCGVAVFFLSALFGGVSSLDAQEFRVYTRTFDLERADDDRDAPVVSRSLTIFRAGKAYGYIENLGEVIIFEPARKRVTMLSTERSLATTVTFSEIDAMLAIAHEETEKQIANLRQNGSPDALRRAAFLTFQLAPNFKTTTDPSEKRLTASSGMLRYHVTGATVKVPEAVETYVRYTDWMAKLNYALHPRLIGPRPRLALNEEIRATGLIPTEIELHSEFELELPIHLRVGHQVQWSLDSKHRSLLHHWESLLRSRNTRHVTFKVYMQKMLLTDVK